MTVSGSTYALRTSNSVQPFVRARRSTDGIMGSIDGWTPKTRAERTGARREPA